MPNSNVGENITCDQSKFLNGEDIPDGFYVVRVKDLFHGQIVDTGEPIYILKLQVIAPTAFHDKSLIKPYLISEIRGKETLTIDMQTCGLELSKTKKIRWRKIAGLILEVYKKTNIDQGYDLNFIRLL